MLLLGLATVIGASHDLRVTVAHRPDALPQGWEYTSDSPNSDAVQFVVLLKPSRGGPKSLADAALAVSTPGSAQYGKHKTLAQIRKIIEPSQKSYDAVQSWLEQEHLCSTQRLVAAIRATCSLTTTQVALRTTLRSMRPIGGQARWRHVGPLSVPSHVSAHVDLVAGLSELFDGKAAKLRRSRAASRASGASDPSHPRVILRSGMEHDPWLDATAALYASPSGKLSSSGAGSIAAAINASSLTLTPALQRQLYAWTVTGNKRNAPQPNASFGIAAFDDDFSPAALEASRAALGMLGRPMTQRLGSFKFLEEVESDLDVQWSTALAPADAPSRLTNQPAGFWILEWALEASKSLDAPGSPRAWSLSYGWPEDWQCGNHTNPPGQQVAQKSCAGLGYSSQKYIEKAEMYLSMLAAAGVTVLASSGDSGAPGFASNNPVDLSRSVPPMPPLAQRCSYWNAGSSGPCESVTFVLETQSKAICVMAGGQDTSLQTGCAEVQQDAGCLGLLEAFTNVSIVKAGIFVISSDEGPVSLPTSVSGMHCAVDLLPYVMPPACKCGEPRCPDSACKPRIANFGVPPVTNCSANVLGPITNGTCTLRAINGSGFQPQFGPAFQPSYPATSAWITAVGATQLPPDEPLPYAADLQLEWITEDVAGLTSLAGFTSGGGFSNMISQPKWQAAAVQAYLGATSPSDLPPHDAWNASGRAFPDIAWNGHNELIFAGATAPRPGNVGGTSASSPSLLGLVSTLNAELSARGASTVGHLAPLLYHLHSARAGGNHENAVFRDVIRGDIRCTEKECRKWGFSAAAGWDPASGLGTLRADAFLKAAIEMKTRH
jgi:hypothetical protein